MTIARQQGVALGVTRTYCSGSYYVRRVFLCGKDYYSGQSFEHMGICLEEHLLAIPFVFCIGILVYWSMQLAEEDVLAVAARRIKSNPDASHYLSQSCIH